MGEKLQFSSESLGALLDASAAINATQTLEETLDAIVRAAAAVMRAEAASVIMLDKSRGKQVFCAAVGRRADELIKTEYEMDIGISAKVLESGQAAIINDVTSEPTHFKKIDTLVNFETRSLIAAPLIHRDQRLGVVEVLNPVQEHQFSETDRQLAQVFANLAAIAVVNSSQWDRLRKENRGLKETMRQPQEMVGDSAAIQQTRSLIARVAASGATVLLLGETGTGKEVAARLIHAKGNRSDHPFIPVNCAALPSTLLESELFGHEAGAFTGAVQKKLGRFELADGGTIFLDEIAEVSADIQVTLLRVLEDKEIVRLGATSPARCDARIIAATNRNLAEDTRLGRFREDLYYRLNVFPIEMPPLRRRKEDIPLLAKHFLKHLAMDMNIATPTLSSEALGVLSGYDFPGNVRELQNVLERACLLCCSPEAARDTPLCIRLEHLPSGLVRPVQSVQPEGGSALTAAETAVILEALTASNWNQSEAARALGISRDKLRYRINKYGISRAQ